jgi:hypothetical protein
MILIRRSWFSGHDFIGRVPGCGSAATT